MKFFKKILLLALACLTFLFAGIVTACNNEGGENTEPVDYVYKVRTQSEGGYGLRNVNVTLYDGADKVAAVNTNALGNAFFLDEHIEETGKYRIELTNIPEGWHIKDETVTYQTSNETGTTVTVNFIAQLITDQATPSTKMYRLGDVMYDFTVETSNGNLFTLSEALKEKKMVMINLWATWCGPCMVEFPYMQQAYAQYEALVDIVALSVESSDSQSVVASKRKDLGITFSMVGNPEAESVSTHFSTASGVPVSLIIDRYGVVSYWHVGNMISVSDFTNLFDKFVGDDYVQTVIDSTQGGGSGGGSGNVEIIKPTVSAPDLDDVADAMSGDSTAFTYGWEDDEYSWPWTVEQSNGKKYLAASNVEIDNSYAILNATFEATANTVLAFDKYVSTEANADILYVMIDGAIIHTYSGAPSAGGWDTCYAYVFETAQAGKHTLSLVYRKDSSISGEDDVFVSNLRILDKSTLDSINKLDLNIMRYAATDWNDPADMQTGASKVTKFQNYATVKLGSDGYYHVVDNASDAVDVNNDPLLLAAIMDVSQWNMYDLWQLAYSGLLVYNGHDLESAVEEFAWAANESANGYVPVTEDLKELLDMITQMETYGEGYDEEYRTSKYFDNKYHVSYHENEWLELCLYYDHYGNTPQMKDPTLGITFAGAIEIFEDRTNEIDCFKAIVPLGIKHKFIPEKTGIYHFYSIIDTSLQDTSAATDPQMWLFDKKGNQLAYNDDSLVSATGNAENFDIYYQLEAGETYYCLFAFFLNATGKFEMEIDYLGSYYEALTNCAIGPYSYNEVTNETYVQTTTKIAYDEATDTYRVTDENGKFLSETYEGLDDAVYLDLAHATYMFPSQSIASIIETAHNYDEDKQVFYLPDENNRYTNYNDIMKQYLFFSYRNEGDLYGFVKVDAQLMDILSKLTKRYDGFGGVKNSWQMMCYFYQPIGTQTTGGNA